MIPTPRIDAALCERLGARSPAELAKKMPHIIQKAQVFYEKARAVERELVIALDENQHCHTARVEMTKMIVEQKARLEELEMHNHVLLEALRETIFKSEDSHSDFVQTALAGRIALEKLGVEQPKFGNFPDGEEKEEMEKAIAKVVKKV